MGFASHHYIYKDIIKSSYFTHLPLTGVEVVDVKNEIEWGVAPDFRSFFWQ